MRNLLLLLAAVFGLWAAAPAPASAAPVNGAVIGDAFRASIPTDQVRWYCYNRYSGRFLHWGRCGHRHYYRPWRRHYRHYYHRPRWHVHYRYY